MKKADLKDGGVYAFSKSRDTHYNMWPVMIVDAAQLYVHPRRGAERLVPADPGRRTGRGSWSTSAVGYLSVRLRFDGDDPEWDVKLAQVRAEASAEDAMQRGLVSLKSDLGAYELMTSLPYLHGDYLTVKADLAERERISKERKQRQAAEESERRLRVLAIKSKFEAAGLDMGHLYVSEYHVPGMIELTLDQAEQVACTLLAVSKP